MKTSKILINNLHTGQLPSKEVKSLAKRQFKKLSKKLNLPKHVKLVVHPYRDFEVIKPLFETIEL